MLKPLLKNVLLFLSIFLFSCENNKVPLSEQELEWIKTNQTNIRVTPDPAFPPIDFINEEGEYKGVSADILRLIEQRTGLQFTIVKTKDWNTALTEVKNKTSDIVLPTQKTEDRLDYLSFTEPYIEVPTVIVTTRKNKHLNSIELLRGKKVAVVKDHAIIEQLIEPHYSFLNLNLVKNAVSGLLETSFGEVDAMLAELPIATFYIEKMGITNLSISGRTSHKYDLAIASRKDLPILNSILKKTLLSIEPGEIEDIKQNWIKLDWVPFYKNKYFQVTSISIILLLLASFYWNRFLKKEIDKRKKTEKKLSESRDLLDATGQMAKVGGWELDPKDSKVKWTKQTYRIYELPLDYDPPLEEAINYFHINDRKKLSVAIEKALNNGEAYDMEVRFTTAKGKKRWTRTICNPQIIDGKVIKLKGTFQDITQYKEMEIQREELIKKLKDALDDVKTLSGLLPICSHCKKIRDDNGYWNLIESYIETHSEAAFSHGMCPDCSDKFYGKENWYIEMKKKKGIE